MASSEDMERQNLNTITELKAMISSLKLTITPILTCKPPILVSCQVLQDSIWSQSFAISHTLWREG